MKKLLLVLTLACLPLPAWAQGPVTKSLQSTTCATTGCLALGVEGFGSAAVQLVFTGTATAVVEGSVNGTDFRTLQISASDGSGNVTSATSTGMWYVNVGGITQVRVRLSICTSCSVIAHIQGSRSGGGASGGGAGGGDATAANQSTQITSLQILDHIALPEDSPHVSGESGVLALAVRNDLGGVMASDGDRIPLSIDSTGALRVTGGTGATQYTQDAALTVATTVGSMAMGRASAAAPTDVSADNDAVMPWYTKAGAQAVQPTYAGTLALADAGVVGPGVQRVTIASNGNGRLATVDAVTTITNVVHVDDNSSSLTVDNGGTFAVQAAQSGTWTVTGATGSSSITMQGTAATDAAVAGNPVYIGGRASAAAPSAVSADGDAVPFWLFRTGNQAVTIVNSDGTVPTIATDATHDSAVSATGTQMVAEAKHFDGAALPNVVSAEGDAVRSAASLYGVQYVMPVNEDGSTVAHVIVDSGGGGGTQYAEDAAHASGDTGTLALVRRQDSAAVSSGTDGDYSTLNVDGSGRLWVNCGTGCNGGTQYTQDAALTVGTSVGTAPMGRASAAAPTDVSADNDSVLAWYLRSGAQVVQPTFGGILATAGNGVSGTGVQRVTLASDSTGQVALAAGSATIGALTANQSVSLAQVGGTNIVTGGTSGTIGIAGIQANDAAISGNNPVLIGVAASAAVPSEVSADGDLVRPWALRSGALANQPTFAGALAVAGNGATTTGVQRVTLSNDSTGVLATVGTVTTVTGVTTVSTVTNLSQLGGSAVPVEDAAETAGGTGIYAMAVRRDTAASSSGTTGDNSTINVDALGKLWVTGSYAEDSVHTSGDTGIAILTKRTDAIAASAGTDGDYQTLNTDASGRLWVNCSTGCSGGTQYIEDAASAGGETLTLAGAVRQNTLASATSADGDYAYLKVDTLGSLYVNPFGATQAAATYLTVRLSDGTNFLNASSDQTEDAAAVGGETGPMILTVRRDSAASSAGTDGDFATLNTDGSGRLWVNCGTGCSGGTQFAEDTASANADVGTLAMARRTASPANTSGTDGDYEVLQISAGRLWASATIDAALPAGTNAIGKLAANTGVTIGAVELAAAQTLATVTTVSTVTSLSQLGGSALPIEDAAETAGGVGIYAMAVRRDTAASSSGTTGDNSTINVDALGKLWVTGSYPEDAAHTTADTGLFVMGRRIDTLAASSGSSGDYEAFNMNASGALWTTPTASTNGGADSLKYTSVGSTEDKHVVKATAGTLYSITATNTNAAARYLRCENDTSANTTPGSETPELDLAIPGNTAGSGITFSFPVGLNFSTAWTCWVVTGAADTDVAEVAANEIKLLYSFK